MGKLKTLPPHLKRGSSRRRGKTVCSNTAIAYAVATGLIAVLVSFYASGPTFESGSSAKSAGDSSRKPRPPRPPPEFGVVLNRSSRLIQEGQYRRAAEMLEKQALPTRPDSFEAWTKLGVARRLGWGIEGVEPAIEAFESAAALRPKSAELQAYLSAELASTSRLEEARNAAFRTLALQPDHMEALVTATRLTNFSDPEHSTGAVALVEKLTQLIKKEKLSPREEIKAHFALFKALDGLGEHSAAAKELKTANRLENELNSLAGSQEEEAAGGVSHAPWRKEGMSQLLISLIMAFKSPPHNPEPPLQTPEECPANGPRPLLIVGLPRSGSTIVQQMLRSHPSVFVGDEFPFLSMSIEDTLSRSTSGEDAGNLNQMAILQENADEIGHRYLAKIMSVVQKGERDSYRYVIDKQLANAWWIGAVPLIFSCGAKVITLERSDLALGFGNFKTHFTEQSKSGSEFAYDLSEIGWRTILTRRVMAHWRHVLPKESLLSLTYEDLVTNPEGATSQLLRFLDLPHVDACSRPHENKAPIVSSSGIDLRQPLHPTRYREAWQRYAFTLEPLMTSLHAARNWVEANVPPAPLLFQDPPPISTSDFDSADDAIDDATKKREENTLADADVTDGA